MIYGSGYPLDRDSDML